MTSGLKMLDLGHSFSLNGPTLSRPITYTYYSIEAQLRDRRKSHEFTYLCVNVLITRFTVVLTALTEDHGKFSSLSSNRRSMDV